MEKSLRYDQTHRLTPLYFFVSVVAKGQGESISAFVKSAGAYAVYFLHGNGTAPNEFYEILGGGTLHKDVLISVIAKDSWPDLKEKLKERFALSNLSSGIAFVSPLDSVAGVSIYKMLSNSRHFEHPLPKSRRKSQ
ncbi:MAG: hypothetical protein SPI58_02195 [Candidatus Enteromonas sp.]|nr:hypothetical protein [Candidatus Enteromonas sp.]MDY6093836.1 hypothetical protein [Candidatus Enteromonas sp.]